MKLRLLDAPDRRSPVGRRLIFAGRLVLTAAAAAAWARIANRLEYFSQIKAVDNFAGAAPLILSTGAAALLIALFWRRKATARTAALAGLALSWALLFMPAVRGVWYPSDPTAPADSPDLTVYAPGNMRTAKLPGPASISIAENQPALDGAAALYPVYAAFVNAVYENFTPDLAACTNTPNAYRRIIKGDCDIIFVAGPSEKQLRAAEEAGANLVFTPIGREAFVFLAGVSNPLDGLSLQQLKNIYSGKTAHWRTLGWAGGGEIIAFQRPEGSGSQTGLQRMMDSLPIQRPRPLPDKSLAGSGSLLKQVSVAWRGVQPGLGFSYRYFAASLYPNREAKLLKIDGVYPSNETIANGSYPLAANFYAVSNGPPAGETKRLIDWILTAEGQFLIESIGYVPLDTSKDVSGR